jgi:tRNA(adenine34) deaminase
MTDEYYMMLALKEARKAFDEGEVPIGAVIVMNEKVIARGYNQVEKLKDPTAHGEIIALTSAFNFLGAKYLPEGIIYITVEPCVMCAGAIYWSQMKRIVYGADDEKNGYKKTAGVNWPFHPKAELVHGILKEECGELMKTFFRSKR